MRLPAPLERVRLPQPKWAAYLIALLMILLASPPASPSAAAPEPPYLVRFAFSRSMFSEVNENDVRASMKLWTANIVKERGLSVDPESRVYSDINELTAAVNNNLFDAIVMTTEEYWGLKHNSSFDRVIASHNRGSTSEEYLLLVHQEGSITNLTALANRALLLHRNPRTCLAQAWIDVLFMENGLPPAAAALAKITPVAKPSKAVLPVFFNQADACITTRRAFDTVVELNPQVGKKIRILASSPPLIPSGAFFRSSCPSAVKDRLIPELVNVDSTVSGQQVMTVFQTTGMVEIPLSGLASSTDLLERHARLSSQKHPPAHAGVGPEPRRTTPPPR